MINGLVSIIIPVYNVEKYIKDCLESVFNQTYKNIELVIVDDRGNDHSMDIVNDILKFCTFRYKIITHNQNYGVSKARNTGIKQSSGDFIFFLDGDDLITSNCIEILHNYLIKSKSDLVISDFEIFYNSDNRNILNRMISHCNHRTNSFEIEYDYPIGYIWNILYKKSLIVDNQIYFEQDIKFAEDALWITLIQIKARKIIKINYKTYFYRIRNESSCITLCARDKYVNNLILVVEKLFSYIESGNYSQIEKGIFLSRIRSYKNGIYSSVVLYNTNKCDMYYDKLKKIRVNIKDIINSSISTKKKIIELIFSIIPMLESYFLYKLIFKVRLFINKGGKNT